MTLVNLLQIGGYQLASSSLLHGMSSAVYVYAVEHCAV